MKSEGAEGWSKSRKIFNGKSRIRGEWPGSAIGRLVRDEIRRRCQTLEETSIYLPLSLNAWHPEAAKRFLNSGAVLRRVSFLTSQKRLITVLLHGIGVYPRVL